MHGELNMDFSGRVSKYLSRCQFAALIWILCGCGPKGTLFRDDPPVFLLKSRELDRIPARRKPGDRSLFLRREVIEPASSFLAVESKREAANVNSVGLTVDSHWFENRIGNRAEREFYAGGGLSGRVSPVHEPTRLSSAPAAGPSVLGEWRAFAAGNGESGPWVAFRDERNRIFLLQFDHPEWPGLKTSSTLAANLLLHEAGYNVPERHMVFFTLDMFAISPKALFYNSLEPLDAIWPGPGPSPTRGGRVRLTMKKLHFLLHALHREEDGSIRALATTLPDPATHVYLGPFPLWGRRPDDPNDYFEHQDMRELRGLRIMAAWLGLHNIEERSGADFFNRKTRTVSHFIWDFRGALGSDIKGRPKQPEAALGIKDLDEETRAIASKERSVAIKEHTGIGYIPVEGFSPGEWKPAKRHPAFVRATAADIFWAGRILAAFTSKDIKRAVDATYLPERTARMLWARLWLRTRRAVRFGLSQSAPFTMFSAHPIDVEDIKKSGKGSKKNERERFQLCAVDLWRKAGFEKDGESRTKYIGTMRNTQGKILGKLRPYTKSNLAGRFCTMISPKKGDVLPDYVIVELRAHAEPMKMVEVHLRRSYSGEDRKTVYGVVGIVR